MWEVAVSVYFKVSYSLLERMRKIKKTLGDSRRELGIFLFTTVSRTALGPTQPPIQGVPGALSLGVKRPGREANHSPPSSAEVKERRELYLHSSNTPSWRGAHLKHRDLPLRLPLGKITGRRGSNRVPSASSSGNMFASCFMEISQRAHNLLMAG
jgi:hypothetical protein